MSSFDPIVTRPANFNRRHRLDQLFRGLAVAATLVALVPLVLIIGFVLLKGLPALSWNFFTNAYEPPDIAGALSQGGEVTSTGGVLHGIVGSFLVVGSAMLIALPIGILAAIFLSEYRDNPLALAVRFCTDVLSGAPSIVVGIVAYNLIVRYMLPSGRPIGFSGWAGSVALAVLTTPIIVRTTEEMLKLVPLTTREAAMGVGAPKWRYTFDVVIPTALSGIVTGALLAFARAAGETAPLLLTILGRNTVSFNLLEPLAALPLLTYKYTDTPFPAENQMAWGSALVLTALVVSVNALVRWATRTQD